MRVIWFPFAVLVSFRISARSEIPKAPSFLHTCPFDSPDMNACIVQKSKETLPGLLKGDKQVKIPSFLPLKLKEVIVNANNIVFKLLDLELYGLETAELVQVSHNMKTRRITALVRIKELRANGTYDVNGQIMVLPIKGHGPGYLQFSEVEIFPIIDYSLEEREGNHYMHFEKVTTNYKVKGAAFHFESLFNGDKALGDQMNVFLNENWNVFHADLKPGIMEMIRTVLLEMCQRITTLIPYETIFPGFKM